MLDLTVYKAKLFVALDAYRHERRELTAQRVNDVHNISLIIIDPQHTTSTSLTTALENYLLTIKTSIGNSLLRKNIQAVIAQAKSPEITVEQEIIANLNKRINKIDEQKTQLEQALAHAHRDQVALELRQTTSSEQDQAPLALEKCVSDLMKQIEVLSARNKFLEDKFCSNQLIKGIPAKEEKTGQYILS